MIPRIIHYCWFGKGNKTDQIKQCIDSWKKYCPDYKIIEWNEVNFDITKCNRYVKEAYEAKRWAFVSDYVRLQVVYQYGGIYLDTDVEVIKNLDQLLEHKIFMGMEAPTMRVNTGSGFGAEKGSPFLKKLIQLYDRLYLKEKDGTVNITTCTDYTTVLLKELGYKEKSKCQKLGDIMIYSDEYFSPVINGGIGEIRVTENTFSIHHYTFSWMTDFEQRIYLKRKNLLKKYNQKVGIFLGIWYKRIAVLLYILKQKGIRSLIQYILNKSVLKTSDNSSFERTWSDDEIREYFLLYSSDYEIYQLKEALHIDSVSNQEEVSTEFGNITGGRI